MNTVSLRKIAMAALLALTSVMSLPQFATAHGQPVITVNPEVASAGGEITVTGSEMEPGEVFAVSLESAQGSTALGTVKAEGEGEEASFAAIFVVPESLKAGPYIIRAATEEGEVATADLTVTAPASQASAAPAQARTASGELHQVERLRPAGLLIGVIAVALISGALGAWLIWPRRQAVA